MFVRLLLECLKEVWKGDMGSKGGADSESREEETAKSHDSGELWGDGSEEYNKNDLTFVRRLILMLSMLLSHYLNGRI